MLLTCGTGHRAYAYAHAMCCRCQPSELGWGTHEKEMPPDGARHTHGSDAAIFLNRPGCTTKVV